MLIRRLAQPMIASLFIAQSWDALRHPQPHVEASQEKVDRVAAAAGIGPVSPRQLTAVVRTHAAVTLVLGARVALGRTPRTSATLLALATAPVVSLYMPENMEEAKDPDVSGPFLQRLAALGGLVMIANDRGGKPSLGWRVGQAKDHMKDNIVDRRDALRGNA